MTETNPTSEIYFNRLTLPSFSFYRWAAERGAPAMEPETAGGFLIRDILGDASPKSVAADSDGEIHFNYWGQSLQTAIESDDQRLMLPAGAVIASVRIPTDTLAGRLNFSLRCSPVVRRKNSEIDAYLADRAKLQPNSAERHRAEVYQNWLQSRIQGATITTLHVMKARLEEIHLPGQRSFKKATAQLRGGLDVTDPHAFAKTLTQGVGRGGNLGFGTFILSRA